MSTQIDQRDKEYESGYKGACFTCEPVGELNKSLTTLVLELVEVVEVYEHELKYVIEHAKGSLVRCRARQELRNQTCLTKNADKIKELKVADSGGKAD